VIFAGVEIDLDAMRGNVERLRALVAPARVTPVLKANAYGHGLLEVARALADRVDGFCVYRADEALALREDGIANPLHVLGPIDARELRDVARAGIEVTLWDTGRYRDDLAAAARTTGAPIRVHAKIDTGVTRLGLDPGRAAEALASYLATPEFDLCGVFTHLAAVEELESSFTLGQLATFERATADVAALLRARGVVRHAAASAAAILFPTLRLDRVRPGIATYGIWPSLQTRSAAGHAIELSPALRWRTQLVVVRNVEAGRSVGYGCTHHVARPSTIGVIPIGYAEGLPRAASDRAEAIVAGRRVPIVGRVCMNMAFVDVTGVDGAHPGAAVTLIGADGAEQIDANDLGERCGTIGYEIVARIPESVPRRYLSSVPSTRM
jgi:alanine racemase